ncbi:SDR family NAD(P)-dependent oxidoreductase [Burkholderia ambifaria]|uniref:type I polyketide synthase n=1 Tax=Burkholderia ambifaria TaxID=152480 RepID=UPI001B94237E|nr:type I polyketide synthase [Burkholderia ambifaria]MBR8332456.1 SDR family NAD(P)-dependent oxidoreductase [Burkholderia ambifaria]
MDSKDRELLARQRDAIRQGIQKIQALSARLDQPVAIVGIGCRVPGADSPEALWELLRDGREALAEVPPGRWDLDAYYDATPGTPYKTYARRAGYLDEVDHFDARFFGISPREAQRMDPQQRLLLEVSHRALEDAELPVTALREQPVGVFVGISSGEYAVMTFDKARSDSQDAWSITGTSMNSAAGRLAYHYGFNGPALAIDTACSSSLVAIHQAVRSLLNEECHTALAGGVNCLLTPEPSIALAQNKVLSASGRCSPFSAEADGLVRGEGCGMLVLKRLDDALAQGCRILAVIRGSHVNQDGASSGLTVPNGYAQQALIATALKRARLAPGAIGYVEAHGTGTALGDPIEIKALQQALGAGREAGRPVLIGALKAHIGHLEAASGVAGVIKTVLALRHRLLPAQINLGTPTPHVDWSSGGVAVVSESTPIAYGPDAPFYAGVSSFGFSGTNAHLILQDPVSAVPARAEAAGAAATQAVARFVGLSAKDPAALRELLARCHAYFREVPDWAAACEALNAGRAHYAHRAGFVARDRETLLEQLAAAAAEAALEADAPAPDAAAMAWLFTGQGSQYAGMGSLLYDTLPAFRACLDAADRALAPHLGESVLPVIRGEAGALNSTRYTQPAIFALQYALSHTLLGFGLTPRYVLGHSIGEYAAAVLAGVFELDDAARMIVQRGRLMEQRCAPGGMLVLLADPARAATLARAAGGGATLAVANGPASLVYAGPADAIERLANAAREAEVRCVPLPVSHAFHSPMMEPMLAEFAEVVRQTRFSPPRIAFVSTALGRLAAGELTDPDYWVAHVREAVRFDAAVAALGADPGWREAPARLAIEIGPNEQLIGMARQMAGADAAQWRGLLRPRDDQGSFAETLRAVYLAGLPLRWPRGMARDDARPALPGYPFQRQRYWLPDAAPRAARAAGMVGSPEDREPALDYALDWIDAPVAAPAGPPTGRWLLFADEAAQADALNACLTRGGAAVTVGRSLTPVGIAALGGDLSSFDAVLVWPGEPASTQAPEPAPLVALLALVAAIEAMPAARRPALHCVGEMEAGAYRPLAAALAALCRSLHEEAPELRLGMIGVDAALDAEARAAALAGELAAARGVESERWVSAAGTRLPRLVAATPLANVAAPRLRADRSYLVTGGTGALGALFSRALIEAGARDVVLSSRRGPDAEPPALRALAEAHGARLSVIAADLADAASVERLFAQLAREHAPLAGLVHAAGQVADAAHAGLDADAFRRVFEAKVEGAWRLDAACHELELDFFLMLSSISSVLGAPGQANYAAANAALDALARRRHAEGRPALSLCLGAVAGEGMAADPRAARHLQRAGVGAIEPARLLASAARWFAQPGPQAIVAAFDWARVAANPRSAARPLLQAFMATFPAAAAVTAAKPAAAPARVVAEARAPTPAETGVLLRESIAEVLDLPDPGAIGANDTLHALGMDSITLVELRDQLVRRLGRELPSRLLFDFPQVGQLARYLALGQPEAPRAQPAPAAHGAAAAAGREDIAVIGIGCRFPGGIDSPETFWAALRESRDLIGEIDALRWDAPALQRAGALTTTRAGVLDGVERFDCELFGITPREAQCMDPQQRLLLETSWEALERAGYDFGAGGTAGGVFIGPGPNDYARRFATDAKALSHHHSTGNALSVTAGRLAFVLDWQGPALAVDTACSSSLMALHLAVQALRRGECSIALAGGVNLLLSAETSVLLSKGGMLAPDGRCKTFDAAADGYVRSEGCAMVVLKRLGDALAAGDEVLAVVRGSAANQDGHSQGLTAPNGQAQQRVLRNALADAALDPARVGLLEAHGTGTPLGDPIEFAAARAVYGEAPGREAPLWIGSVKTNLGHAEAAAGIAGFIKAVLCLRHEMIVPHLHFTRLNPEIELDEAAMRIPGATAAWRGAGRYAAVSSFGFSGTNVHVVLEAAPAAAGVEAREQQGQEQVPGAELRISAASPAALRAYLLAYRHRLATLPPQRYGALLAGAARRARLACTRSFPAANAAEALAAIEAALAEMSPEAGAGACGETGPRVGADLPRDGGPDVPVYPFDRQRFWLAPRAAEAQVEAPRPAAQLGLRLTARDARQVIYALDYASRPPFRLDEHLVHGERVVPAAAHLALIVGMLGELRGERGWTLADVVCETALVVGADSEAVRYVFDAEPDAGDGGAAYRVAVLSDGEGRTRCHLRAEARALPREAQAREPSAAVVAVAPAGAALSRFDGATFYDGLYGAEIGLAGAFRGVLSIEQHVGQARAELAWPAAGQPLVPGVLDSLFQTIALATLADQPGHSHMNGATIPFAIDRLVVLPRAASTPAPVIANTRLVSESADGASFVHDLEVAEVGRPPFLRVEGLLTRRAAAAQLRRAAEPLPQLVEHWVERRVEHETAPSIAPRLVLLDEAARTTARSWLAASGEVIDASGLDDAAVLAALGSEPAVLLAGLPAAPAADQDLAAESWRVQLLGLVGAVRRAGRLGDALEAAGATVRFGLLSEAQADLDGQGGSPLHGFALGLAKSLSLEWPGRAVTLLDVDGEGSPADAAALAAEWRSPRGECIAWRGGRRHVRRVTELAAPPFASWQPRADGPYLLTGGLGDLAAETCRWLADEGVRHVWLTGRREADAAIERQLDALREATGLRVDYRACDIADRDALATLFADAARDGPLRGIFHCAGVLADGAFATLDDGAFERVARAKVLGSWNLHQLSRGLDLDAFVLYSSLASLLGSAGQANYAAANGFMDQLARSRRALGLPALSLNWPGWDGVGMAARNARGEPGSGLRRLAPERALGELGRALASGQAQVGIADVDWSVFGRDWRASAAAVPALVEDWFAAHPQAAPRHALAAAGAVPAEAARELAATVDVDARLEIARRHLVGIVRRIMALDAARPLAQDKSFHELGLDSLMAIELKRALQEGFAARVPATVMFDYPDIDSLAHWLAGPAQETRASASAPTPRAAPADASAADALDQLDEGELANVLDKLL